MKKITLLLLLVIAIGMTAVAGPVDSTTAKNVALNFWRSQIIPTRQDATNVQLRNVAPQLGFSQLYLMQNEAGEGYVIVAADDRAIPAGYFLLSWDGEGHWASPSLASLKPQSPYSSVHLKVSDIFHWSGCSFIYPC